MPTPKSIKRLAIPRVVAMVAFDDREYADANELHDEAPDFVGTDFYGSPFRICREAVQFDAWER